MAALVGHKIVMVVVYRVLAFELVGNGMRKKFGHSFQHLLGLG